MANFEVSENRFLKNKKIVHFSFSYKTCRSSYLFLTYHSPAKFEGSEISYRLEFYLICLKMRPSHVTCFKFLKSGVE